MNSYKIPQKKYENIGLEDFSMGKFIFIGIALIGALFILIIIAIFPTCHNCVDYDFDLSGNNVKELLVLIDSKSEDIQKQNMRKRDVIMEFSKSRINKHSGYTAELNPHIVGTLLTNFQNDYDGGDHRNLHNYLLALETYPEHGRMVLPVLINIAEEFLKLGKTQCNTRPYPTECRFVMLIAELGNPFRTEGLPILISQLGTDDEELLLHSLQGILRICPSASTHVPLIKKLLLEKIYPRKLGLLQYAPSQKSGEKKLMPGDKNCVNELLLHSN